MKTPRVILFQRHQDAAPKLDAIRKTAVAAMKESNHSKTINHHGSLLEFLFSLRWHLAGMSALWLVIAFLDLNAREAPPQMAAVPRGKIPSTQIIMASLRENRRELLQVIQPAES